MTRTFRAIIVCAVAAFMLPVTGDAQGIKGLIKKKVSGEAKGEKAAGDSKQAESALAIKVANAGLLTDELIEDFFIGLQEEIRLRKQFKTQLAAYKKPEDYRACGQQAAASPEMQKIIMSLGNVPEGTTTEQMQRISEKMQLDMQALLKRKCGVNIEEEWPVFKRRERLVEIEKAGANAFDAAQSARTRRTSGPAVDESTPSYSGSSVDYYAWLKDVTFAFCKSFKEQLIVLDDKGVFDFGFSSPVAFSNFMTQSQASAMHRGCVWVETHDDLLDLLELQR